MKKSPITILILEAMNERTETAFGLLCNSARYLPPAEAAIAGDGEIFGQEALVPDQRKRTKVFHGSRLQLTFDQKPAQIERGFTFSSENEYCDIYLGNDTPNRLQFSITFDKKRRLILTDTSTDGAWVAYNNQCALHPRHDFTWILLSGFSIILQVGSQIYPLLMKLDVPSHRPYEELFEVYVELYIDEREKTECALQLLDLYDQAPYILPTCSPRTNQSPQYYKGNMLGKGGSGVVYEAIDVSTCIKYALKEFRGHGWVTELEMMKKVSHVSSAIFSHRKPH